jgi:hypothetical protein
MLPMRLTDQRSLELPIPIYLGFPTVLFLMEISSPPIQLGRYSVLHLLLSVRRKYTAYAAVGKAHINSNGHVYQWIGSIWGKDPTGSCTYLHFKTKSHHGFDLQNTEIRSGAPSFFLLLTEASRSKFCPPIQLSALLRPTPPLAAFRPTQARRVYSLEQDAD